MSEKNTAAAEQLILPKHGEFCWSELSSKDAEKSQKFYSEIFGWDFQKSEAAGMEYFEIGLSGGRRFGGMWQLTEECSQSETGEMMPGWMDYIAVDDVDASAEKAVELGGALISSPMDIPNTGRFCMIKDPTGAIISLITLKH